MAILIRRRFYAFKDITGWKKEPKSTHEKILFKRKTTDGAVRYATRELGARCVIFEYQDYFDRNTFVCIYPPVKG